MRFPFGLFSESEKRYFGVSGICRLLEKEWRQFKVEENSVNPEAVANKFQQQLPMIICDILWNEGVEKKDACQGVRDLLDEDLSEVESAQGEDGRYIKSQLKSLITALPSASDGLSDDAQWSCYRRLEANYSILYFCMKDWVSRGNKNLNTELTLLVEKLICIREKIISGNPLTAVVLKKEDLGKLKKIDVDICALIKKISLDSGSMKVNLQESLKEGLQKALEISMELKSCNHFDEKVIKSIRDAMQA